MLQFLSSILQSLSTSWVMFWGVLWALILGFLLSAFIQAFVSKHSVSKLLGQNSVKQLTIATLLGAASSSCSYAAVSLARSLFNKGASLTNSLTFTIASTNLVIELGIILFILLGWQFTVAEILGGLLMITLLTIIFHFSLNPRLEQTARIQSQKGRLGKMEGHASMDMSLNIKQPFLKKLFSAQALTSISHLFFMDWYSILPDIILGFLIAGILETFVSSSIWNNFFLANNPSLSAIEGPLIGPLIAILSFVCSIGNVPLALVLWNNGLSFGGVISFLFADLIILPILNIYRKYYGRKVMVYILICFYFSMTVSGFIIEILFSSFNLTPIPSGIKLESENLSWNYTSYLNILFLGISLGLLIRFLTSRGLDMLKMMNQSPSAHSHIHH